MKLVRIVDEQGLFIADEFVDELTQFTIETPCQGRFYLPKWDGEKWVEGRTAEEIAEIQAAAQEQELTDIEKLKIRTAANEDALAGMMDLMMGGML